MTDHLWLLAVAVSFAVGPLAGRRYFEEEHREEFDAFDAELSGCLDSLKRCRTKCDVCGAGLVARCPKGCP